MSKTALPPNKIQDMTYIAMFAVLLTICSWISIPTTIPFTLQTFGVFISVGILGGKRGTLSVIIYLLLGIIGVPVFSGFTGGLGRLMSSTGGYLVGLLALALLMWILENTLGERMVTQNVSMFLGLLLCYALGTLWFVLVYMGCKETISVWSVLGWCVFPYVIPDIIKIILATMIIKKFKKII